MCNTYDKLYQIYKAALVEESSICPIVGFITDCFGSANQVYGLSHGLVAELLFEQMQENDELSCFFNVADAMNDSAQREGCAPN